MDHQPLPNPTVFDWNKAVMRCLTRGIACLTGYGLSVYAGEDVMSLHRTEKPSAPSGTERSDAPAQTTSATDSVQQQVQRPAQQACAEESSQGNWEDQPGVPPAAEPPVALVEKMLMRIGNISAQDSIDRARGDLSKQFAGTEALKRFEAALTAKEQELGRVSAAA